MLSQTQNLLKIGLVVVGLVSVPVSLRAGNGYPPTQYGGNFGLGLELGDPGTWGFTGKIWIDRQNAFLGAVKLGNGAAILQLDYLWHSFDLIHMRNTEGEMPLYIGAGGNLLLENSPALAARLPLGISYIFDKKNVPVDIYLQLVPTLWFFGGGTAFRLYPELGAHYYF